MRKHQQQKVWSIFFSALPISLSYHFLLCAVFCFSSPLTLGRIATIEAFCTAVLVCGLADGRTVERTKRCLLAFRRVLEVCYQAYKNACPKITFCFLAIPFLCTSNCCADVRQQRNDNNNNNDIGNPVRGRTYKV